MTTSVSSNPTPILNHSQPTLSTLLSSLKKAHISPLNRLRSVARDAEFVSSVARSLGNRPLVANERCGSWYVRPDEKRDSAYFKSTDGHAGQWGFSLRRLNLQLLGLVGECDGCIIVDSTRRGKRMPDALSKTIPIWCAVLNMALFPSLPASHALHTPPLVVSPSEHAQIEARLPTFLQSLLSLNLGLDDLRKRISKPLRPIWITPDSKIGQSQDREFWEKDDEDESQVDAKGNASMVIFEEAHPIILLTASSSLSLCSELSSPEGYVQGAADDAENWAMGLSPQLFWAHHSRLLSATDSDLPSVIAEILAQDKTSTPNPSSSLGKEVAKNLFVHPLPLPEPLDPSNECQVVFLSETRKKEDWIRSRSRMEVGLGNQRVTSKFLRSALPDICAFVEKFLVRRQQEEEQEKEKEGRIVIACESGKDISIGAALAIRCFLFDDEGDFRMPTSRDPKEKSLNKAAIRMKLSRVMLAYPEANPHRSTLQSVNSFLMG